MNLPTWMIRTLSNLALRGGLVVMFIGLAAPASAGLVLTIGPNFDPETRVVARPSAGAPTTVTLTAYLSADAVAGTELVAAYDVPIDLSLPAGFGSPIGMTLTGATARTLFPGLAFRSEPLNDPHGNGDYIISVLPVGPPPWPPGVVFNTSPTPLFDFTIAIDSTVALGDYFAGIVQGGLFSFSPNLTDKVQLGPPATIHVVPEPSTLGVLGCLVVPFVLRRSRRSS